MGLKSWDPRTREKKGEFFLYDAFSIVPEVIAADYENELIEMIEEMGPGKVGINIPSGGGLIYNR